MLKNFRKTGTRFLQVCWFLSLAALVTSYYQEYSNHLAPCYLCLGQRWAYLSIFFFSSFGYFYELRQLIVVALLGSFLALGWFSGHQTLLELGIIEDTCSVISAETMDEFINKLENPDLDCSKAGFSILGIKVFYINFLISCLGSFYFSWRAVYLYER